MQDSKPALPAGGIKRTIADLEKRYYPLFRAAKFGIAGVVGFAVVEAILIAGVFAFYHTTQVPSIAFSSTTILGLYAVAFVSGGTVGFFINERITVHNEGEQRSRGARKVVVRLLKYQLAYLLANIVNLVVALALLAEFALSPVYGNVVGAVVAFPVGYFISMQLVWKVSALGKALEQD